MSLSASQASTTESTEALTIATALTTLDAMLRADRAFELDVVEQIEELFRALHDEYASVDVVKGLLNLDQLLQQQVLFKRAAPASIKALRWARQLGNRSLVAKALTHRGALALERYDLSLAFEAFIEALQVGKEIGDTGRIATCYLNLGVLMHRMGRERAAMACTQASLEWSTDVDDEYASIRAVALLNLSDRYLKQCNWGGAVDLARKAQAAFDQPNSTQDRTDMNRAHYACALQNEVSALVYLGDFESAQRVIGRLGTVADEYPSVFAQAYLRIAVAMYEGFTGSTAKAAEKLNAFASWPHMRDEALRCLIDIYERSGETERALDVTRALLECLRTARLEVNLADLKHIDISSLSDDDGEIRHLLARSARFAIEVKEIDEKFHAKLTYLFELAVSAELREEDDAYAGEHIYRVGRLCAALATQTGCGDEICWLAEVAGRVHDVGKTSLPSHTILKTEPLSDGEKDFLRSHVEDGAALVAQLAEPRLVQVVAAIRHHHERWDGQGYPSKLKADEIPLLARLVAICDSFDAMTHSRSYRAARSIRSALQEIERCAGSQFEPRLAGFFVNLVRDLQRQHGDLDEYLGEPGRRTRGAKSHPELMRLLEDRRSTL